MLNRLAIFGLLIPLATVCLLTGQTAPLSPPKQGIAKPGSSQDGKDKAQPQGDTQAAPKPMPASPQPPATTCDEACQQSSQNFAIQRKVEWFTGVLAIVGVLQVLTMVWQAWLLKQTRGDVHTQAEWMKTQAGHMETQSGILEKSVTAAQTSANAAKDQIQIMKERERARLAITPMKITELFYGWIGYNNILFEIENHGPTSAFNVRGQGYAYALVIGNELPKIEVYPFPVPDVIKANSTPPTSEAGFFLDDGSVSQPISTKAKIRVELCGSILYDDILGNPHATEFQYFMDISELELIETEQRAKIKTGSLWRKTLDGNGAT